MHKYVSKCMTCSGQLSRKKAPPRPYGAKGTNPYCHKCDVDYRYDVSKSSERRKAKLNISREVNEQES